MRFSLGSLAGDLVEGELLLLLDLEKIDFDSVVTKKMNTISKMSMGFLFLQMQS